MGTGVSSSDFAKILTDLGKTISYEAVTRTYDSIQGDETLGYATATDKTWVFLKRLQSWMISNIGLHELGDAYLIIPATDTINRKDRITADGETYEVREIKQCKFGATTIHIFCVLYKLGGTQA